MLIPDDLLYSSDHEWIRPNTDGTIRLGVTDHAQDALGDVVFVELPDVETTTARGDTLGEIESTKTVSDLFAPVGGTIIEVNSALVDNPELINTDPYGEAWICSIRLNDSTELNALMNATAYSDLTTS